MEGYRVQPSLVSLRQDASEGEVAGVRFDYDFLRGVEMTGMGAEVKAFLSSLKLC